MGFWGGFGGGIVDFGLGEGIFYFGGGIILELNGLKLPVFGCKWIKLVYLVCFCARNMGYSVLFLILE